jgi:general secretion pathway protein I
MSFLICSRGFVIRHSKYFIPRLGLLMSGKKPTGRWTLEGGFTLLEIVIALAILSLGLISAIEVFSNDLRMVLASKEYTQALTHAQELIEELNLNPPVEGTEAGEFPDGYKWQRLITPYAPDKEESSSSVKIFEVKVIVSWSSGNKTRDVELTTLRTVLKKNETKRER